MHLLEMKHIKKEFGGVPVIKDISLSVEQGEMEMFEKKLDYYR